jgi:hypothetical protein
MTEQAGAECHVDSIRRVRHQVHLEHREDGFEHDHDEHSRGQHMQRRNALVHQHLVDDHLCEQRGRQTEQLNHEGRGQNLAQSLAILPHRRDKPVETEWPVRVIEAQAGLDQYQFTGPYFLKLCLRQALRPDAVRVAEQHLVERLHAQQDRIFAGVELCDGRQLDVAEPGPIRVRRLGCEAELLRREEELGLADPYAGVEAHGASQLHGIGRALVVSRHDAQADDSR